MQAGVYGQSLPTDGNTRKIGGRAGPPRKEVILCGNFPPSSCEPAPGRDAGLRQGSSQRGKEKMLRMFGWSRGRARRGIRPEESSRGGGALGSRFCPSRLSIRGLGSCTGIVSRSHNNNVLF